MTTRDDEASRRAIAAAVSEGGVTTEAAGEGEARGGRRREGRSASELGTASAVARMVAHVTQPVLWEPGVT